MAIKINGKNYDSANSYMLQFNPNVNFDKEGRAVTEEWAVQDYVATPTFTSQTMKNTIDECREVLAMDPFPWEQIADTADRTVWNEKTQKWDGDDPKSYHKWLTMVTDMLELEARKQGKL